MADRIILHIGTMKTGTSYLQSVLMRNADVHEQAGFLFLAKDFSTQARAVRKVLAAPNRPERHEEWRALAEEAKRFEGHTAVVSMEFLSFAREHQIDAYLRALEGLQVEAVITLRDQAAVIPAQWQSYVRLFGADEWSTYLRRIDPARQRNGDADSHAAKTFRRAQNVLPMLERWQQHPGVSRLSAVTVPPPTADRHDLWRRFCGAIGLDPGLADLTTNFQNVSMGYASTDVQRRLNPLLTDYPSHIYRPGIRPVLRDALRPLRNEEGKPVLDRGAAAFAHSRNAAIREALADLPLFGDPDDLPVDGPSEAPRRAPRPKRAHVQRAAVAMWERCASEPQVAAGRRPRRLGPLIEDIARMLPDTAAWQEAIRTRGWERT